MLQDPAILQIGPLLALKGTGNLGNKGGKAQPGTTSRGATSAAVVDDWTAGLMLPQATSRNAVKPAKKRNRHRSAKSQAEKNGAAGASVGSTGGPFELLPSKG